MMSDIIDELKKVTDLLYEEKNSEAYSELARVIPKMSQAIGDVEDEGVKSNLVESLKKALMAMENYDVLMLADTIQYELLEILAQL